MTQAHATTIVAVKRDAQVAIAGDGQVTVGDVIMKQRASKVRRMFHDQVGLTPARFVEQARLEAAGVSKVEQFNLLASTNFAASA